MQPQKQEFASAASINHLARPDQERLAVLFLYTLFHAPEVAGIDRLLKPPEEQIVERHAGIEKIHERRVGCGEAQQHRQGVVAGLGPVEIGSAAWRERVWQ